MLVIHTGCAIQYSVLDDQFCVTYYTKWTWIFIIRCFDDLLFEVLLINGKLKRRNKMFSLEEQNEKYRTLVRDFKSIR